MKNTSAVTIAKSKTKNAFSLIEKKGNKNVISGLKISTLNDVFSKGYCIKTTSELKELGLMDSFIKCDGTKRIFALSLNVIFNKIQIVAIK